MERYNKTNSFAPKGHRRSRNTQISASASLSSYNFGGFSYIRATQAIARILYGSGIDDAQSDARLIAEHVFRMEYSRMITCDDTVTAIQQQQISNIVARRIKGEPLQYIIERAWFYGREFHVRPGVLIPRRDSEVLAAEAIRRAPRGAKVLDMCCGSGCLGVTLAKERPDIILTLADIGGMPCEVSAENAELHDVDADVVRSDLFDGLQGRMYDMIICNPPYIPSRDMARLATEVRHEPALALDGGQDGLDFYRRLLPEAKGYLTTGGLLGLEFGFGQQDEICKMLDKHGYYGHDILVDMVGRHRAAIAWRG